MLSMREYFRLTEYTEEFINKIIDYRMHQNKELNRYLSCEEIADLEKYTTDDVKNSFCNRNSLESLNNKL